MRTAIYLRISLDHTGEGLAVERQKEDCLALAKARGWEVVGIYEDTQSASNRDKVRLGYNRLETDFDNGLFEAIICYDLDRLTRQPRQLEDWIDKTRDKGLTLVTANGEADLNTDAGRLFAGIKIQVARAEVERKGARQRRALRQKVESGRMLKGRRRTGYEIDGSVRETEATFIREVFERFASGEPINTLVKDFNQKGVLGPEGIPIHRSLIRGILRNARYCGRNFYKGEFVGMGSWKPIVSEELFDLVQSILSDPKRITNHIGMERKYLGSGLFQCSICDKKVSTNGRAYWCKMGGHIQRATTHIDQFVREVVADRLENSESLNVVQDKDDSKSVELAERAKNLRNRLEQIGLDYDQGIIDGVRYASARDTIESELKIVETERIKLAGGNTLLNIFKDGTPGESFLNAPLGVQRAVVGALVEVRIHKVSGGRKAFDEESIGFRWK
jgi:DNA invertase Pin-like site-specific DNA recombinase